MILTDLSQLIHANVYMGEAAECAKNPSTASKNMIKHSVFNSIRANYVLHKKRFGDMILCCDSETGYWRKDYFPNYKCQRTEAKKNAVTDIKWGFVNEVKAELIDDLDKYFPFTVISVSGAEGDDCIGVLTKYITENVKEDEEDIFGDVSAEKILILSSDRDNFQLQKNKNVSQWSPQEKKLLKCDNPTHALIEKIVRGEAGPTSDSIPNVRMGDDTFITRTRQKPIKEEYLQSFLNSDDPISICKTPEEIHNFLRNEKLISYDKIPTELCGKIIDSYLEKSSRKHSKMGLMGYFTSNKMVNLLGSITDFYK